MKLPSELEDQYVKNILYNKSLKDLPDEKWKTIEGFENYAISSYGRVKSCERWVQSTLGQEYKLTARILKPICSKNFNAYLQSYTYNLQCTRASGWVLREMNQAGTDFTGRMIQYHPGTPRHFGGAPYWKVSSGNGTFRIPLKQ